MENYFEVLELNITGADIKNLKNQSDTEFNEFTETVKTNRTKIFNRIQALVNNPGISNQEIADKKDSLIRATDILSDRQARDQHIDVLLNPTSAPDPDSDSIPVSTGGEARVIIKFPNGEEATSIPQLATLMEQHAKEATDMLYRGRLEQALAGAGEAPLADTAEEIVKQFSSDRSIGWMAMVAVLRKTVKMSRGIEVRTPQELARLIDQNWEESKTLLYNGFISLWFKYTNQEKLANTVQRIVNAYRNDQDIGLEKLVQRLDPSIGHPEFEVSQSEIDFGRMDTESQKTIQFEIKNMGRRGFLYGDVQLAQGMPGLQISNTEIQGDGVFTVELDASALTAKRTHQGSLVVKTNGGELKVPISCYIDYPSQQSIQRVAISGFSLAAIALVTRLIIQQFGISGWLVTGFADWPEYWNWIEWFEWPWFEWKVYTLAAPETGVGFVIGFVALGAGAFAYWFFFFRKKVHTR